MQIAHSLCGHSDLIVEQMKQHMSTGALKMHALQSVAHISSF